MSGKVVSIGLLVLVVLSLAGCAPAAPAEADAAAAGASTAWTLPVVTGSTTTEMTMEELQALPQNEVEFLSKETGTNNVYTGVLLKELCQAAGADLAAVKSVEVEAEDGFLAIMNPEMALGDGAYLVLQMDGGPLPEEMGRVRVLVPGEATKFQVKMVKQIIVK